MDTTGLISQSVTANSVEDFLHDSCQVQQKVSNCTVAQYFQAIISQHNSQVEDYKKFKVGSVTVTDSSGSADRYLDYEDTFDAITNRLIDVYGGYVTVDYDTMTINYLSSIGSQSSTPLKLAFNMKSASKTIDPTSVITRLIPTGADVSDDSSASTDTSSSTTDKQATTAKIALSSPNYVDNTNLINTFGKIVGTENFSDVTDTNVLKQKAQYWLAKQVAVESWEIGVSNLYLINKTIGDFKIGNQYQFINDFVSETQWLQVIEIDVDIVTPTNSTIKVGDTNLTQSRYINDQAQQKKAISNELSQLKSYSKKQDALIVKQQDLINKISANYSSLSETVQNIIDNNNVWISGQKFIDTSSDNGTMSVSDFTTLYNAGVKGIIVKATEGTDYINPDASSHLSNANSAGIKTVGAYHFLKGTTTGTAQGQAFLAEIQALGLAKTAIVACDIEDSSLSFDLATLNSMIADFYKVLTDAGYTNTADYASASWFSSRFTSSAKYKWIASIGVSTKPSGADAWQYTWTFNGDNLDCSYSYNKAFI
jgi:GH25 family lysozyme M1 (1,4-beta-N-acetylmuramidase)